LDNQKRFSTFASVALELAVRLDGEFRKDAASVPDQGAAIVTEPFSEKTLGAG
jgi:hypothetical protein